MTADQGHPTTIDAGYTGGEPPVDTILTGYIDGQFHAVKRMGEHRSCWQWAGMTGLGITWEGLLVIFHNCPFTVARWGAG